MVLTVKSKDTAQLQDVSQGCVSNLLRPLLANLFLVVLYQIRTRQVLGFLCHSRIGS